MSALLKSVHKFRFYFLIFLFFAWLILIGIIYPLLPLTGDEAWNYLGFARYGSLFTLTHYELPNNHIFFTFIQSLFVHKKILVHFPLELRLFNCIVGATLLFLSGFIVAKITNKKFSIKLTSLAAILVFFASPLLTPYFIVGRGYLLGSLFLLIGIYLFLNKKFYASVLAFILSVWTIPSFAFAIPLIYVFDLYNDKKNRKKIFATGFLIPIISFMVYLPVIKQLISASSFGWGYNSLQVFLTLTFNSLSNLFIIPFGSLIFLTTYFLSLIIIKNEGNKKLKSFVLFLFLSNFGYVIFAVLFFSLNLSTLPFIRNGIFIPLFISFTNISAYFNAHGKQRIFLGFILVLNLTAGIYLFSKLLPFNKSTYPFFDGEQKYTSSNLTHFLNNGGEFIKNDSKDTIQIMYFSFINSVPIK